MSTNCRCGRPSEILIDVEPYPIVSNDAPFGRDLCRQCAVKHRNFKTQQLTEWLDYFKPRLRDIVIDQSPQTTALKKRLEKKI